MRCLGVRSVLALALIVAGCVTDDRVEVRLCPDDSLKTEPGVCGCDVEDVDSDGDTIMDCVDSCPADADKTEAGVCGCGVSDVDTDGDTTPDCFDHCPADANKTEAGVCGCGVSDVDSDGDTIMDCLDHCPEDADKTEAGICGCGVSDVDTDADTVPDCLDACPEDPGKTLAGVCGCGVADSLDGQLDRDGDGVINCLDGCPDNPYKTSPGDSTCEDVDTDGDGVEDAVDDCPYNPTIQTLPDGGDCNLTAETTENGETIDVFEVWSAYDLIALDKYLKKSSLGLEGAYCDEPAEICSAEPNTALFCTNGRYEKVACYGGCQVEGDKVACKPKEATENHEIGESCKPPFFACTSSKNYKKCDTETNQIVEQTCSNGKECVSDAGTATDPCKLMNEPTNGVTVGGNVGDACKTSLYKMSCATETTGLVCIDGKVAMKEFEFCRNRETKDPYKIDVVKPTYELRVKIMKDIELAEALPIVEKKMMGCAAEWTPMSLHGVDFDGQGHTIYLSQSRSECMLNNSLFSTVVGSRVANLTLSYNIGGYAPAVLALDSEGAVFEHLKYNGERRITSQLFSENIPQLSVEGGGALGPAMFGVRIEKSRIEDVKFDIPELSSVPFVTSASSSYIQDVDVKVKNQYCEGAVSEGNCTGLVDTSSLSVFKNVSFDVSNFEFLSVFGKGRSWVFANKLSDLYIINSSMKYDAINLSNVGKIDRFGVFTELRNANIEKMDIQLGNIVDDKERASGDFGIQTFKLMGDAWSSARNILSDMTITLGNVKARYVSLFFFDYSVDMNNWKVEIGNIDSGNVAAFRVRTGNMIDFSMKTGDIAADGRVSLFNFLGSGASSAGLLSNWRVDLGEINAYGTSGYDYISGTYIFDALLGFEVRNMTVNVKRATSRTEIAMVRRYARGTLGNIALYGHFYGITNVYPFIRDWEIDDVTSDSSMIANVAMSVSGYKYQPSSDSSAMENITPVEESIFLGFIKTEEGAVIANPSAKVVKSYWLRRTVGASAYGGEHGVTMIPYSVDEKDFPGESVKTAQGVVTDLGSGWYVRDVAENGKTVKIPWLKDAALGN